MNKRVVLSSLGIAVCIVGASGIGNAQSTSSGPDSACLIGNATCADTPQNDVTIASVPAGFRLKDDVPGSPKDLEPRHVKTYEADKKPWIGPGGPVGKRIVIVSTRHPERNRNLEEMKRLPVPNAKADVVGDRDIVTGETNLLVKDQSGASVDVPMSQLVVDINSRTTVVAVGEGMIKDELLAAIKTMEIR